MAHQIEQMAYVGATPWHGLGNNLPQKQPIEVWQREAGMDWQILESPVHFKSDAIGHLGAIHSFPEQKVLYRSDTKAPLSVVSQRYHTVQPKDVLEFYRDLTEVSGYELETAGVLKGGRKFWALARTGQSAALKGNDQVNGYLLLATSCDGTLATTATPTTIRVVCNNTLTIALDGTSRAIKVPHSTRFDGDLVKKQLGIAVSQWDEFMYRMRHLTERKVRWPEAMSDGHAAPSIASTQPGSARVPRSSNALWIQPCNWSPDPLPIPPHNARPASLQVGRYYFCKVHAMKATSLNRSISKTRPALRLVSTKELPREDWLQIRKQGIGSSDAAAAVGLNPYKSQLELWMEKTGRDVGLPKADPQDEESPMYWGNVLEPIVAWHYSKRTKNKVRRINAVLQHPDPELPWMLANIDREVISADDVQILECKTAGINGARLWKEGVPEYVQLQVMHQLAVTGKQAADVAVLLGGQMLEIHRIERDEQMIARLIELERQFWHYVETDTPPPADGTASAESALRCLYPEDNGQVVDFSQHAGLTAAFIELKALRQSIADKEKREAELKQMLQQAMGDASRAEFSSGYVSWRKAKDSIGFDVAQLLKDKPHLQAKYPLLKPGARRFLVG